MDRRFLGLVILLLILPSDPPTRALLDWWSGVSLVGVSLTAFASGVACMFLSTARPARVYAHSITRLPQVR
jgi:hypothetical protein